MKPRNNYTISVSFNSDGEVKYFFNGMGKNKIGPAESKIIEKLDPHIRGIITGSRNEENYTRTRLTIKIKHRK